jgi:DNA invertase Pin-like site-specific DNA recombinase
MEKAFAYLRVSDPSQVKGDGYTRQLKAIKEYASGHDLVVAEVYREAWTGTERDRPALARLMVSLEQNHHGITTVLIERLDRLAREYFIQEAIIRDFRGRGYRLISANVAEPDLCSDDPTRKLLRTFMGAIAEYDKSMLVAKLRAARDRVRERTGKCAGRKGYRELPAYSALVARVRALYSTPTATGRHTTLRAVADTLNLEGTTTMQGHRWSVVRVQQVIRPTDQRARHARRRARKLKNPDRGTN